MTSPRYFQYSHSEGQILTTNDPPTISSVNIYNATAGSLVVPLPPVVQIQYGRSIILGKSPLDISSNTITFNCAAGDTFSDGSTSVVLYGQGQQSEYGVITIDGIKQWQLLGNSPPTVINLGIPNVISVDTTILAGNTYSVVGYIEVAAGRTLEIGAGAYLDIT